MSEHAKPATFVHILSVCNKGGPCDWSGWINFTDGSGWITGGSQMCKKCFMLASSQTLRDEDGAASVTIMHPAADMLAALNAAAGYLLNAKIDLETGAPKKTAIATIEGGLKVVRAAIARVATPPTGGG